MTIQEILEAHQIGSFSSDGHNRVMTCSGCREQLTGQGLSLDEIIRAHVAEVLDKHMQERCYEAWSAGWHDSHYQHTANNEHRGHAHPEVGYSNPYRKDITNGR